MQSGLTWQYNGWGPLQPTACLTYWLLAAALPAPPPKQSQAVHTSLATCLHPAHLTLPHTHMHARIHTHTYTHTQALTLAGLSLPGSSSIIFAPSNDALHRYAAAHPTAMGGLGTAHGQAAVRAHIIEVGAAAHSPSREPGGPWG